jgi:hypothetical protein
MRCVVTILGTWMLAGGLAAADVNHCEITTTGDATATVKADAAAGAAKGKLSAATDYWLSDSDLRGAIGAVEGIGTKLSKEEKQRKIDEAMKKDPRFVLLLINCLTDDGGVIFSASDPSKYADVPMKPASYPIVPVSGTPKAGQVTAMFHLTTGGKRDSYRVTAPGKLVLTQFDKKGIAGTFSFKAEGRGKAAKHIDVTGKFSYECIGGACQK